MASTTSSSVRPLAWRQGRQLERPTDRRGRGQDLRRQTVDAGQPFLEHGPDTGRHAAVHGRAVGQGLREVQRQSLRRTPQRRRPRPDQQRPRDGIDEGDHVLPSQPLEDDDRVAGHPGRQGGDRSHRVVELFGPPGADDRQATTAEPTDEVGQRPERGVVGPVQVVDDEQARLLAVERRLQRRSRWLRAVAPGRRSRPSPRHRRRRPSRARSSRGRRGWQDRVRGPVRRWIGSARAVRSASTIGP